MKLTRSITYILPAILLISSLCLFAAATAFAEEDEHVEHSVTSVQINTTATADTTETMEALIAVLQQLIALLTEQIAAVEEHDHSEHEHTEVLVVGVEVHGDRVHIHVTEPGKDEVSFFLDEVLHTDEEGVIVAIATETGLSEESIRAVITFPSDESDEHEDEHEEDMYDGIHIMSDATVMLGSGDPLNDATVTSDGMIMLADGTLLEPAFDLR